MNPADLRARAEAAMRMTRRDVDELAERDVQRIIHELQVHQVELDMQNESLRCAQDEIEALHQDYQELFECAPIAYTVLDEGGQILRANAAAISLLKASHESLPGRYLRHFVVSEDQKLLAQCVRDASNAATCELRLGVPGPPCHVWAQVTTPPSRADVCLVALIDISERERAQRAMESLNQELEERARELAERNHQLHAQLVARSKSEWRPLVRPSSSRTSAVERALLLDDDGVVRRVIAKMLTALGFEVTQADSGERGLALLRAGGPSLRVVVLNWGTLAAREAQVLETLRELQPQLPVLLMSDGHGEDLATYDGHLVSIEKPMTMKQLQGGMRALLGS